MARRQGRFNSGTAQTIRNNAHRILALPRPENPWTWNEIADENGEAPISRGELQHWSNETGILEDEGSVPSADNSVTLGRWSVSEDAWQTAERFIENKTSLPCCNGGTGFVNLGDGKYECSNEDCDAIHSRAVIEEVFL